MLICKFCKKDIDELSINYLKKGISYYHKDCYKEYLSIKGFENNNELTEEAFNDSFDIIKEKIDRKLLNQYLELRYEKLSKLDNIKISTSGIKPDELLDMWIKLEKIMNKANKNILPYDLVICQNWYQKYKQSKVRKEIYNDDIKKYKSSFTIIEDRKEFDIVDILEDFDE